MRTLFLILVLANLGLFAWDYFARQAGSAGQQIALLQMSPEKIKPVGVVATVPPRTKPAPAPVPGLPAACVEWGVIAGPDVARADAALAEIGLPQGQLQRLVTDAGGYWVYIPPLKTRAEADKKVGELKALGITDFFVVQDAGAWRFSISLGIFRSEEAAKAFLAVLKEKGVRSAVADRRENFLKQIVYYLKDPSPEAVAKLTAIQRDFSGSEIKAVPCPAAAPAG